MYCRRIAGVHYYREEHFYMTDAQVIFIEPNTYKSGVIHDFQHFSKCTKSIYFVYPLPLS